MNEIDEWSHHLDVYLACGIPLARAIEALRELDELPFSGATVLPMPRVAKVRHGMTADVVSQLSTGPKTFRELCRALCVNDRRLGTVLARLTHQGRVRKPTTHGSVWSLVPMACVQLAVAL